MAKKSVAVKKAMTKSEIMAHIADETELSKRQVVSVFDALEEVIKRHMKSPTVGIFTLPGLLKIKTVKRPARKAQQGVPNPFKPGELMNIPARPASMKVKVLPLKKLKDLVK